MIISNVDGRIKIILLSGKTQEIFHDPDIPFVMFFENGKLQMIMKDVFNVGCELVRRDIKEREAHKKWRK